MCVCVCAVGAGRPCVWVLVCHPSQAIKRWELGSRPKSDWRVLVVCHTLVTHSASLSGLSACQLRSAAGEGGQLNGCEDHAVCYTPPPVLVSAGGLQRPAPRCCCLCKDFPPLVVAGGLQSLAPRRCWLCVPGQPASQPCSLLPAGCLFCRFLTGSKTQGPGNATGRTLSVSFGRWPCGLEARGRPAM